MRAVLSASGVWEAGRWPGRQVHNPPDCEPAARTGGDMTQMRNGAKRRGAFGIVSPDRWPKKAQDLCVTRSCFQNVPSLLKRPKNRWLDGSFVVQPEGLRFDSPGQIAGQQAETPPPVRRRRSLGNLPAGRQVGNSLCWSEAEVPMDIGVGYSPLPFRRPRRQFNIMNSGLRHVGPHPDNIGGNRVSP